MSDRVDAVIVGSGAAGSLMAARLAEAGKRVLILEAGPARGTQDLHQGLCQPEPKSKCDKQGDQLGHLGAFQEEPARFFKRAGDLG